MLVSPGRWHAVVVGIRYHAGIEGIKIVELLADYQFYEVAAEELGLTGIDGRSRYNGSEVDTRLPMPSVVERMFSFKDGTVRVQRQLSA